jgi:hypothetical protein
MATRLWHVPVRLATGAIILDQGLGKLGANGDTANSLHGRATTAVPSVKDLDSGDFSQILAWTEIGLGTALLAIGIVPSGLAGLGLTAFAGNLTRLYLKEPGNTKEGGLLPTLQGIPLAKDSWMLAIGTALVIDSLVGPRRRRRRRRRRPS